MDRVTVEAIIVNYNTRDILREALTSLCQHPPPDEIAALSTAVIDNASSDGSVEMVEAEFPDVRLVRSEENLGYGLANNILARSSTADYVMLLNSDIRLTEDVVEPLLRALESDPRAILASPRLVFPDGRVQYSAHVRPSLRFEFAEVLRGTRLGRLLSPIVDPGKFALNQLERDLTDRRVEDRRPGFVWSTCWLIRQTDIQSFGLFDENFPMYDIDMDYCMRAAKAGRTFLYVPTVQMVHLGGSSSTSSAKARLMVRGRRAYYERHRGLLTANAYVLGLAAFEAAVRIVAAVPKPRWWRAS